MAIAVLNTDVACPECGHTAAWAHTISDAPSAEEAFQCPECNVVWRSH
ncbi:DUF7836 family putative zinc-binding protein [Natronomonas salsuginis]